MVSEPYSTSGDFHRNPLLQHDLRWLPRFQRTSPLQLDLRWLSNKSLGRRLTSPNSDDVGSTSPDFDCPSRAPIGSDYALIWHWRGSICLDLIPTRLGFVRFSWFDLCRFVPTWLGSDYDCELLVRLRLRLRLRFGVAASFLSLLWIFSVTLSLLRAISLFVTLSLLLRYLGSCDICVIWVPMTLSVWYLVMVNRQ